MSTKLHHGWRLKGVTMLDLLGRLFKLRDAVQEVARQKIAREQAARVANLIDGVRIRGRRYSLPKDDKPYKGSSVLSHVAIQMMDETRKAYRSSLRSASARECNVTVHPIGQLDFLVLLFDDGNPEYKEAFKEYVRAEPFPYWDNTDPPEDMSDSEWAARGDLWSTALGNGVPAENGYSFNCMVENSVPVPRLAETLAAMPSVAERRKSAATDLVTTQIYRRIRKNKEDLGSLWTAFRRTTTTPEGHRLVQEKLKEIRGAIRRIAKKDLSMPITEIFAFPGTRKKIL
jgi:hypothetical protein